MMNWHEKAPNTLKHTFLSLTFTPSNNCSYTHIHMHAHQHKRKESHFQNSPPRSGLGWNLVFGKAKGKKGRGTKKDGDLKTSVKEWARWEEEEKWEKEEEEELFGSLTILLAWLCHGTKLILPSLTDQHTHTQWQTDQQTDQHSNTCTYTKTEMAAS